MQSATTISMASLVSRKARIPIVSPPPLQYSITPLRQGGPLRNCRLGKSAHQFDHSCVPYLIKVRRGDGKDHTVRLGGLRLLFQPVPARAKATPQIGFGMQSRVGLQLNGPITLCGYLLLNQPRRKSRTNMQVRLSSLLFSFAASIRRAAAISMLLSPDRRDEIC